MGFPWVSHGFPTGFPLVSLFFPVLHGCLMGLPRVFHLPAEVLAEVATSSSGDRKPAGRPGCFELGLEASGSNWVLPSPPCFFFVKKKTYHFVLRLFRFFFGGCFPNPQSIGLKVPSPGRSRRVGFVVSRSQAAS